MFGRECRYGIPFFIRNNVFLYNVKAWRCVKRGGRIVLTPPRMLMAHPINQGENSLIL